MDPEIQHRLSDRPSRSDRRRTVSAAEKAQAREVSLRRIGRLFLPYRWPLLVVIAIIVASSAVAMASPFLLRAVIDTALPERNLPLLEEFFERHAETFEWVRPVAGPIGFPRVRGVGDVEVTPGEPPLVTYELDDLVTVVSAGLVVGGLLYLIVRRTSGFHIAALLIVVAAAISVWLAVVAVRRADERLDVHAEVESLLVAMIAGVIVANASAGERFHPLLERLAPPVYVVFFTLTGLALHLDAVAEVAPLIDAVVAVGIQEAAEHLAVFVINDEAAKLARPLRFDRAFHDVGSLRKVELNVLLHR